MLSQIVSFLTTFLVAFAASVGTITFILLLVSWLASRRSKAAARGLSSESASDFTEAALQGARSRFRYCAGESADLAYDQSCGQWVASVPLCEDGPNVSFVLEGVPADCPGSALLAAIALIVHDAPPVVHTDEERPEGVAVRKPAAGKPWQIHRPCERCGGVWLNTNLTITDSADSSANENIVRMMAKRRIADYIAEDSDSCPQCLAQMVREHDIIDYITPCVWYDTMTSEWMLWTPLDEDTGISVPLGIRDYFSRTALMSAADRQMNS